MKFSRRGFLGLLLAAPLLPLVWLKKKLLGPKEGATNSYWLKPIGGEWHHYYTVFGGEDAHGLAKRYGALKIDADDKNIRLNNTKGEISSVAIWDVALSRGDLKALHNGASPKSVQGNHLTHYYPLQGIKHNEWHHATGVFKNA